MWHLGTWLGVGVGSAGLMVGFDDLGGFFPSLNGSVILWQFQHPQILVRGSEFFAVLEPLTDLEHL